MHYLPSIYTFKKQCGFFQAICTCFPGCRALRENQGGEGAVGNSTADVSSGAPAAAQGFKASWVTNSQTLYRAH